VSGDGRKGGTRTRLVGAGSGRKNRRLSTTAAGTTEGGPHVTDHSPHDDGEHRDQDRMPVSPVVVVGASAGGIEALQRMFRGLPADFPGAVFVVLHMPSSGGEALATILSRATSLPVGVVRHGEELRGGRVYVGRGGHHLLLTADRMLSIGGPRENGHRPAVDPLFRSAALYHRERVIGVILSGNLSDGTAGLRSVRGRRGLAVVQEPSDAAYPSMPTSAIEYSGADHVLPASEIGVLLGRLAAEGFAHDAEPPGDEPRADDSATRDRTLVEAFELDQLPARATPSQWVCPDCSGVLWEIDDESLLRFRCRVGHAWTADDLLEQHESEVETAMWVALRSLEDRRALSRALADRADEQGRPISAEQHRHQLASLTEHVHLLRTLLGAPPADDAGSPPADREPSRRRAVRDLRGG
jgi:two-component system chemotaxis response regulator CheB